MRTEIDVMRMMNGIRNPIHLILITFILVLIMGCAASDAPSDSSSDVTSYFFPTTNGLVYTYLRTVSDHSYFTTDTLRCTLIVGQLPNALSALYDEQDSTTLYSFSYTHDAYDRPAVTLSNGDTTVVALDGNLVDSATWIADPVHNIRATVVGHSDAYIPPPPANTSFSDVIVVQYRADGDPNSPYLLRFFARGHGLIRESVIVPPGNTEISSLQMLSIQPGR